MVSPIAVEVFAGNTADPSTVPSQVAKILSPDFPGERLVVCLNPRLREERASSSSYAISNWFFAMA